MIPIADESPRSSTPVVTYCLIALNVIAFAAMWGVSYRDPATGQTFRWAFTPAHFSVLALFTHMFLHAGILHLAGNMLYLWIFGDNVEDVFGRVGYLVFYLCMGAVAALGHYVSTPGSLTPVVGASGAVSGVLAAYVVLFPRSRVKALWIVSFYGKIVDIKAVWMLAFWFALQLLYAVMGQVIKRAAGIEPGVAYWAHIAGFACGLATTAALLAAGVIRRPEWAVASAIPARPRELPGVVSDKSSTAHYVEWNQDRAGGGITRAALLTETIDRHSFPSDPRERLQSILEAISARDVKKAAAGVKVEMHMAAGAGRPAPQPPVLSALVSIADGFYKAKMYALAFELYQTFLAIAAPADARLPEVKLRAGMTASRYLRRYGAALALLEGAAATHGQSGRAELARTEVSSIRDALRKCVIQTDNSLLSGPCVVVRRTSGRIDISVVGRLVSKSVGRPLAEITRLLHSSTGILATDVEPVKAKGLAVELHEAGIPALVIPAEKLVALPAAQAVRQAAATRQAIEFHLGAKDQPAVVKEWRDVFFASLGKVTFEGPSGAHPEPLIIDSAHTAIHGDVRTVDWGANLAPRLSRAEEKTVLDVFTLNPFECYRLTENETRFPNAEGQPGTHRHMPLFICDLLGLGSGVSTNEGLAMIALDAPNQRWKGLTFDGIGDFERYNYWKLQLEQYG